MERTCFVIMPFAPSFDGIWQVVIKPAVEAINDECLRADDIFAPGSIIDDIIAAIRDADYIVADLTGRNPNVYYELGFAHALDKPVILITQDLTDLPFDVGHRRVIGYSDTAGGAASLRSSLDRFLANI